MRAKIIADIAGVMVILTTYFWWGVVVPFSHPVFLNYSVAQNITIVMSFVGMGFLTISAMMSFVKWIHQA